MGVNLVGVVHEQKGAKGFQPYLNASIYFDEEVRPSICLFIKGVLTCSFFNYLATDKISFQTEGNVKVAVYKDRKKNTKEITVNHERSSFVKGGED